MKIRIPIWLMIVVLVPFGLYALVNAVAYFNYWRFLQEQREYVFLHGQECIKKVVPIGDGNAFGICTGKEIGKYATDTAGSDLVVFDSSDQIALPSEQRSELWNFSILNHFYGWQSFRFQGEKIGGHFYYVSLVYGTGPDTVLEEFIKRYDCEFVSLKFSCKKFNSQSK